MHIHQSAGTATTLCNVPSVYIISFNQNTQDNTHIITYINPGGMKCCVLWEPIFAPETNEASKQSSELHTETKITGATLRLSPRIEEEASRSRRLLVGAAPPLCLSEGTAHLTTFSKKNS